MMRRRLFAVFREVLRLLARKDPELKAQMENMEESLCEDCPLIGQRGKCPKERGMPEAGEDAYLSN